MTLVLRYIARSDRGLVRSNNEDSFYAGPRLLALADGMGGHAAGEVASQLVIQSLRPLDDDEPGEDLLLALERATRTGNDAIATQVERSPELEGMGTTLTAILFAGSRIGLCHVGDSRGYLLRDEQITQITRDDTFVQTLVDEGRITAEQAHSHPQRSLIMRALTGVEVEPTLIMREARDGDRYLLCSDGLSDVVSEETISETLNTIADLKECADRLIELALRGGGPDNVTVVVADVVDGQYGETRPIVGGAAGIDEEAYTPDPKTAAGRAAALRPPAAQPTRPSILTDDEEPPAKSPLRRWLLIGGALLAIIVVAIAIAVGISTVRSNYYVGEQDGKVTIFQGSPESFLFISLSSANQIVCVDDLTKERPTVNFVDTDVESGCTRLDLGDLQEVSRHAVISGNINNRPREEAQDGVRQLAFLPLCEPAPVTEPDPPVTPAPGDPEESAAPGANDQNPNDPVPPTQTTPQSPAPPSDSAAGQAEATLTAAPESDQPAAPSGTEGCRER